MIAKNCLGDFIMGKQIADWLESHWVAPAYSGWVLGGLGLCFFGAAINTMAGWLYVLSGISFALLGIAAVLPARSLSGIKVQRYSIQPVSAGEQLIIELEIENRTTQAKTLLQVQDLLPFVLGQPVQTPIEIIPQSESYRWVYSQVAERRGVYRWHTVQLRTATPLGLFWCRRSYQIPATAIVYPRVLHLTHCPLIDEIGREEQAQTYSHRHWQTATAGLTRSLRPYRVGDPIRLIHWRTSARYGELRVRELEVIKGGQEIVICLDSAGWQLDVFEQAVSAAASLYFYAQKQQLNVKLWTARTGIVQGESIVLETLAATSVGKEDSTIPTSPLLWLSQNSLSLNTLPSGSRWLLWQTASSPDSEIPINPNYSGLAIRTEQPLQLQLQAPLR